MEYKSVKGFTGAAQLGFLLVFVGLGFILAGGIQFLIGIKMVPAGTSLPNMGEAMLKAMQDPKNVSFTRLAQISGTFCLFFIPAVLYSWVSNGRNTFWLGFNRHINLYQVLIGFLIMFTANIMASPIEEMTKSLLTHFPALDATARHLEQAYNDQVLALSNLQSWPEFFMALVIMAFFPALFEELFFRGAMQQLFVNWWKRPLLAIIVTSLLFSFIHGSIYLFFSRAVLGFVLGLMYYKTRNIWVNVIAHFLNNAIAVAVLFSQSRAAGKPDPSAIDPKVEWWFAIIAIGIIIFLFRFLDRYSNKNRMRIHAQEEALWVKESTNPFLMTETKEFGN